MGVDDDDGDGDDEARKRCGRDETNVETEVNIMTSSRKQALDIFGCQAGSAGLYGGGGGGGVEFYVQPGSGLSLLVLLVYKQTISPRRTSPFEHGSEIRF